jgi:hypothetical protein
MNFIEFDDGPVLLVLLVEHLGILEMLDKLIETLQTSVGEGTNLSGGRCTFSLLYFCQM